MVPRFGGRFAQTRFPNRSSNSKINSTMKGLFVTALATLALFSAVVVESCKPDKCKQVSCAYGGACLDGACSCQTGYEGEHCETITRNKFKGIYNVNENGTLSGAAQYTVSIEDGPKVNQVVIKNFQNLLQESVVTGTVYKDTLWIPLQNFANDTRSVEGWAYITDTNPLNQHYYQHAIVSVYYKVTNLATSQVNEYGSGGALPSVWSK